MVRFVIYADMEDYIRELVPLLRRKTRERGEWALIQTYIGEEKLPKYLSYVKKNPCLVMVVASYAQEKARKIRENNQEARMLWFSTRENSVYSYHIHVTCFGLLPPTTKAVELGLDSCGILSQETVKNPQTE
ncbi:MAG: hypothetical protein LUE29_14115 [Lachnospiraceae bacterium]|nr:hypothetical protein [Lachnospiraceae bacterium]